MGQWSLSAMAAPTADIAHSKVVLRGLNKVTAHVSPLVVPLGGQIRFGTITIIARSCYKRPPQETPESAAYLTVRENQNTADGGGDGGDGGGGHFDDRADNKADSHSNNRANNRANDKADNKFGKILFSGWMFASSPALSGLDHPIYDLRLIDCVDPLSE